ncbi:MAG: thiamine pyrophosphate-dependent enzyme, partial [Oscillospiraceae bacterium]
LVCPHAAIRSVVLNAEEEKTAPQDMQLIPLAGFSYKFGITVSALDCMGCGSCINVCPGKQGAKALEFRPALEELDKQQYFDYGTQIAPKVDVLEKLPATNARNSQFRTPLLEFSGACAGCGETPYAKLVTQLFGSRLIIANATGCSSIWGASSPTTPYTQNHQGRGPAWANSLFEDNAEFGYGIWLTQNEMRQNLIFKCQTMVNSHAAEKEAILEFIDTKDNAEVNEIAANKLINTLKQGHCNECDYILKNQQYLLPKSVWLFGGDGWAYDIGFSGLDHVMSTNANINALVFDTEVYSNTGGQSSKATPLGAFVKFAAGGKKSYKKNLAEMIINYGHVYVAQIALGADYNQAVRALCEAESYNGPSLIIAYAPCISHGIKTSMGSAQTETKLAVEAGYWNLFRYDPRRLSGQNPFMLDSHEPKIPLEQFLSNELRYSLINKEGPELMQKLQNNVYEQYKKLKQLAEANS